MQLMIRIMYSNVVDMKQERECCFGKTETRTRTPNVSRWYLFQAGSIARRVSWFDQEKYTSSAFRNQVPRLESEPLLVSPLSDSVAAC